MSSFNRVTLVGNLTRDPELRQTKNNNSVTEIGLAMNRSRTLENGQKQEEATFVDVIVWGRDAENAVKYLKKGRSVLVEGRLQMDSWKDSQSGQSRSKLRVVAESVQYMGGNQETAQMQGGHPAPAGNAAEGY